MSQQTGGLLGRLAVRATGPRRRILGALVRLGSTFSAEEVCRAVPEVGRATVYRTLRLLLREGLVCRVPMPQGRVRYRLALPQHHHHLVCTGCGTVQDLTACDLTEALAGLARQQGFLPLGHRLEIYGLCPRCSTEEEVSSC